MGRRAASPARVGGGGSGGGGGGGGGSGGGHAAARPHLVIAPQPGFRSVRRRHRASMLRARLSRQKWLEGFGRSGKARGSLFQRMPDPYLIRVLQLFAKLCLVESEEVQVTFVNKHTRALCSIQIDCGTASLSVEFIGGEAKILLMRLIAKNEAAHKRISKKKPEASSRYLKPRLPLP